MSTIDAPCVESPLTPPAPQSAEPGRLAKATSEEDLPWVDTIENTGSCSRFSPAVEKKQTAMLDAYREGGQPLNRFNPDTNRGFLPRKASMERIPQVDHSFDETITGGLQRKCSSDQIAGAGKLPRKQPTGDQQPTPAKAAGAQQQ